jgi:hypothetical protein
MDEITEFSLETHAGPYETWPVKSRLLRNGQPTRASLPGYVLLHQFRVAEGFLFITDYDCPFEEMTELTLCDHNLRRLSHRSFGAPYCSYLLQGVQVVDSRRLIVTIYKDHPSLVTLRDWNIPYLVPRLKITRSKSPTQAADKPSRAA